jgi:hypothetical protein
LKRRAKQKAKPGTSTAEVPFWEVPHPLCDRLEADRAPPIVERPQRPLAVNQLKDSISPRDGVFVFQEMNPGDSIRKSVSNQTVFVQQVDDQYLLSLLP